MGTLGSAAASWYSTASPPRRLAPHGIPNIAHVPQVGRRDLAQLLEQRGVEDAVRVGHRGHDDGRRASRLSSAGVR